MQLLCMIGAPRGGGGAVGGAGRSDEHTFRSPSAAFLHAAMISSYEASFCSLTVRSTTLTSTVGTCSSQENGTSGDHSLTYDVPCVASHGCWSLFQTASLGSCVWPSSAGGGEVSRISSACLQLPLTTAAVAACLACQCSICLQLPFPAAAAAGRRRAV